MDYTLIGELQGLMAAKELLEKRIAGIQRSVQGNFSAPKEFAPIDPEDPTIIGRDALGRIKRKRHISPELRAKKIALINQAREARLNKIRAEAVAEAKAAEAQRHTTTSVKEVLGGKKRPQS